MCRFGVFPCISLPHFFFAHGPGCKACETLLAEGRELSSTVAMLKETLEPVEPSGAAEMPSFKWIQLVLIFCCLEPTGAVRKPGGGNLRKKVQSDHVP